MPITPDIHKADERRETALLSCDEINRKLGWRGANPRITDGHYTGEIVLSRRAAEVLAQKLALMAAADFDRAEGEGRR